MTSIYSSIVCLVFSCRIKRIEQKDELETEKSQELRDLEMMEKDNSLIKEEIEQIVIKFEALKKFALMRKVPIPLDLESLKSGCL